MSLGRLVTVAFEGVQANAIDVQVRLSKGLPSFQIVGLADKAVAESKERIRNAIEAIGMQLPSQRITVNLSPANVQKEGSHYDLPIAIGILIAMGLIPPESYHDICAMGELALDGSISKVQGCLAAAIFAQSKNLSFICPKDNAKEAIWAGKDLNIISAANLKELLDIFYGRINPEKISCQNVQEIDYSKYGDMQDIRGQESAKRALEIAAAGGLNMLMIGSPGSGKSMLAKRIMGLLPPMLPAECLETTMIYSIAGEEIKEGLINERPFRDPHHSASIAALTGGGMKANPGEISLSHNGVLFLDELPEFQGKALESLRQPLESGYSLVSRANAHIRWPANFQLIAAMNPCRCGYLDVPSKACSRAPRCAENYQSRISGPLLDRFDMIIEVGSISADDLMLPPAKEGSKEVRERVLGARRIQWKRFKDKKCFTNAKAEPNDIKDFIELNDDCKKLLNEYMKKYDLSARSYYRILKVARTIADLDAKKEIQKHHLAESLTYRKTDTLTYG